MKKYSFRDIPQFTRRANYHVNVSWAYLEEHIASQQEPGTRLAVLDLDPDFQRAHVWTEEQQKRYVEFVLRGGHSGRDLLFNCAGWQDSYEGPYVLVDGKQRLESVRKFMRGELAVFDNGILKNKRPLTVKDFEGKPGIIDANFNWHVNSLKTRKEILNWYLEINSGGVVHTQEELDKVRLMLEDELKSK